MSRRVEASAEIQAPITVVYEHISAFEQYPQFVPGLVAVQRVSPRRLKMVAEVAGSHHEWPVRVVEQRRERSVGIALEDRFQAAARVILRRTSPSTTELTLAFEYELDPFRERLLAVVFDPQPQLELGLARFGAWVHDGRPGEAPAARRRSAAG